MVKVFYYMHIFSGYFYILLLASIFFVDCSTVE